MKISRGIALASLMTLAGSPVFAQFSLSDAANAISGMKGDNAATDAVPTSQTADLLGALSQLNVTTATSDRRDGGDAGVGEESVELDGLFGTGQERAGDR